MVPSLHQVNVEQKIFQVYAGGEDPVPHPQPPVAEEEGDKAFLDSLDLDNSHWYQRSEEAVRGRIRQLLLSYKDVFTTPNQKVALAKDAEPFHIELLPNSGPVKARDRGLKPAQIESLKQQLKDWTADRVIKPSTSLCASPLVPVLKKDGSRDGRLIIAD